MTVFFISQTRNTHMHTTHGGHGLVRFAYENTQPMALLILFVSQTSSTHMRTTHGGLGLLHFPDQKYIHAHNPWPWSSSSFPRREIRTCTQTHGRALFFISQTSSIHMHTAHGGHGLLHFPDHKYARAHNPWPPWSCSSWSVSQTRLMRDTV